MTKDEYLKRHSIYHDSELFALQDELHAIPRPVSPKAKERRADEKRRVETVYEHVRRIDELLERTEDKQERRRLLSVRARMRFELAHITLRFDASTDLMLALEDAQQSGDQYVIKCANNCLGVFYLFTYQYQQAACYLVRALAGVHEAPYGSPYDMPSRPLMMRFLADAYEAREETYHKAETILELAIDMFESPVDAMVHGSLSDWYGYLIRAGRENEVRAAATQKPITTCAEAAQVQSACYALGWPGRADRAAREGIRVAESVGNSHWVGCFQFKAGMKTTTTA